MAAGGCVPAGGSSAGAATLGWLLGQYRFERYKSEPTPKGPRVLLTDEPARIAETLNLAEATALVRDYVNLPAQDCGPQELEAAVRFSQIAFRGTFDNIRRPARTGLPDDRRRRPRRRSVTRPAPGRARMGRSSHPRVAIVGKGVVFDTGGLDIKPASGMRS
jgi:leucyl aminopeptidase